MLVLGQDNDDSKPNNKFFGVHDDGTWSVYSSFDKVHQSKTIIKKYPYRPNDINWKLGDTNITHGGYMKQKLKNTDECTCERPHF